MGKKIYPTSHRKYNYGTIKKINEHFFIATFDTCQYLKNRIQSKRNFKSYEKALYYIRKKCQKHGTLIKNIIHDKDTHYECELTFGKVMKFDKEDIDKVQNHKIYAMLNKKSNKWYAMTRINNKILNFSNVIMDHDPSKSSLTVDHINHDDGLNNMKSNLRIATKSEQCINQGIHQNNTSGIKGVHYCKTKNAWITRWQVGKGTRKQKYFSCNTDDYEVAKEKAIRYRNKVVSESEYYKVLRKS